MSDDNRDLGSFDDEEDDTSFMSRWKCSVFGCNEKAGVHIDGRFFCIGHGRERIREVPLDDGKKVTLVAYMTGLAHEKPFSHCPRVEGVELFYANTTFKIPATRAVLGMLMRIMQMEPAPKLRLTIELDDG